MSIPWDVNYVAVIAAAVAGMIIGAIYFSPKVAGNAWMKAIGKTKEEIGAGAGPTMYITAAIFQLLTATVLAAIIGWSGASDVSDGLLVAAIVWAGIAGPAVALAFLFEMKTMANQVIIALHTLIVMLAMSVIISLWNSGATGA
jgi:hypothetical protein